jgi:HlyD family secretion protein
MSTTVDIQTEIQENILTVPIQAVTTRSDSTGKSVSKRKDLDQNTEKKDEAKEVVTDIKEYVFLFEDGIAKMVAVKSGIQDNTNIQILEGLEKDQEIIVGPYRAVSRSLKNDEAVEKVEKDKLFDEE